MPNKAGESLKKFRSQKLLSGFYTWLIAIVFLIIGVYFISQKLIIYKYLGAGL